MVKGVEGNSATFQWTVDRGNLVLVSVFVMHGTKFNRSKILFTLEGSKLSPSDLATDYFKGRLIAAVSGDVDNDPNFICILTLNDLQLNDTDESIYLYAAFVGDNDGKAITLVEVQGIFGFCPFLLELFFIMKVKMWDHLSRVNLTFLNILSFFSFNV